MARQTLKSTPFGHAPVEAPIGSYWQLPNILNKQFLEWSNKVASEQLANGLSDAEPQLKAGPIEEGRGGRV